jgi:hypothetical protein
MIIYRPTWGYNRLMPLVCGGGRGAVARPRQDPGAWHLQGLQEDRAAVALRCDNVEEWPSRDIAPLRFVRMG